MWSVSGNLEAPSLRQGTEDPEFEPMSKTRIRSIDITEGAKQMVSLGGECGEVKQAPLTCNWQWALHPGLQLTHEELGKLIAVVQLRSSQSSGKRCPSPARGGDRMDADITTASIAIPFPLSWNSVHLCCSLFFTIKLTVDYIISYFSLEPALRFVGFCFFFYIVIY